ncbi:MAG: hypothetical protein V3R82_00920 [Candidatus Hydrothermarchaeales archaeon]
MTEASPYLLERLLELIESSRTLLAEEIDAERKEISETQLDEYKEILDKSLKKFEEIIKKYPNDDEIKKLFEGFLTFCEERSSYKPEGELKKLDHFIHDLKHLIDWRIVEGASGRTLGKKSYRSLRGDREKRGGI